MGFFLYFFFYHSLKWELNDSSSNRSHSQFVLVLFVQRHSVMGIFFFPPIPLPYSLIRNHAMNTPESCALLLLACNCLCRCFQRPQEVTLGSAGACSLSQHTLQLFVMARLHLCCFLVISGSRALAVIMSCLLALLSALPRRCLLLPKARGLVKIVS